MKTIFAFSLMFLFFAISIAQERPYPQNVNYEYGYKSNNITSASVWTEYQSWLTSYYVECSSTEARINYNGNTVSEGIGYGLVITAYAGDKVKFDKLLNYYNNRKNGNGVMNWEYSGCSTGPSGSGAATDGDMDAAMGMLVAVYQWPGQGYEQHAEALMSAMRNSEFANCGLIVQKPGDAWGGCDCTNPSYYAPGYYRAFSAYYDSKGNSDNKNFWSQAATDAYTVLFRNQNASTGLVSAWTNSSGAAGPCGGQVGGGGGPDTYQYDACRTPWRIATDYLWWGSDDAKTFLTRIVGFVNSNIGHLSNVVDGYALDGTPQGQWNNTPFVGSFALSGMATSQTDADNYMEYFNTVQGDNYFNSCLSIMYKFLATGNFWNPFGNPPNPCSQPNLGGEKTLCGAGTITLNAGIATHSNRTFTWYRNDMQVQSGSANTYTVSQDGTYKVVMDSAGVCSSETNVVVSASLPEVDLGNDIAIATSATLDAGVDGNGLVYKWFLNDVEISGANARTLVISEIGTYRVEVSASGCATQSDEIVVDKLPFISQTTKTIAIDGVADAAYVNFRDLTHTLAGTPGGTNLAASWAGLWDNTNLYILVKIIDDNLSNDSGNTWYEDDGVEVFVDGDNSKMSSYDGSNDFQWGFVWNTTTINAGGNNPGGSTNGINFTTSDTPDGYIVELAIPWTTIGITPSIGTDIGIDIAINDDDGGGTRENKISWNATEDNGWQNPSLFGTVALTEEDNNITTKTQTINLQQGWNMVSFWVQPEDSNITSVFGTLGNNLVSIKTVESIYIHGLDSYLNTLNTISVGEGYLVYVNNAATVTVEGTSVQSYATSLKKGWNLVGYPFENQDLISNIINQIGGSVSTIRNFEGIYQGTGNLQYMKPGGAYYINVTQNTTLDF